MAEPKNELERELVDLKKEVIEGRNLIIKTDNLLKNLHAELKAVGKRQEEFERRKLFSSGVAYALFTLLAVTGAVLVSNARVASVTAEKDRFEKTIGELTQKLEAQKQEATLREAAAATAFETYRMMTERPGDERLAGVEAFAKMDMTRVSPLEKQALKDRAEALRNEIGQAAFERGKQAFRRNDMGEVVKEMTRFLAMNPGPEDAADASFFLGVAYNQLRQHDKAVQLLSTFVNTDKKSRNRDYAMLLLAQSYEQTGALQKAVDTAREALATYPNSQFASQLRGRLATAKRAANAAEDAPVALPASGGSPPSNTPPAAQ